MWNAPTGTRVATFTIAVLRLPYSASQPPVMNEMRSTMDGSNSSLRLPEIPGYTGMPSR